MTTPTNLTDLIFDFIDTVIGPAFIVVMGLALAAFLWGLAKFIFRLGNDETAVADGKKLMLWGIVALFILVSFMAILRFFYGEFEFERSFGPSILPISMR